MEIDQNNLMMIQRNLERVLRQQKFIKQIFKQFFIIAWTQADLGTAATV